MKKIMYLFIALALIVGLNGCSGSPSQAASASPSKTLTNEEFSQILIDGVANSKGSGVDFYAKAFNTTLLDGKQVIQAWTDGKQAIQAWTDIANSDKNIMIISDYKTSGDEYIHVKGTITGTATGQNAFGGELSAPIIGSATIEKASYIDAVSPTIKTVDVNKEIDQHGLIVKLQKIEIAKNETRLYFEVINNSKGKASFYSFNSKLVQGDKQFEEAGNYDADYKEIQNELLPGIKSDGVISFEPIDTSAGKLTVISEARSDDYMIDFTPYTFNAAW